jgi:CheY-like chemotaxis protein
MSHFLTGPYVLHKYPGLVLLGFSRLLDRLKMNADAITGKTISNTVHVALADDDVDDRELFEEALSRIDRAIKVQVFKNGTELISFLENNISPQVIFLDLNMPGLSGKECLRKIRSMARLKSIPVIIYSTSASEKDIRDTYCDGASLYVLKPVSFNLLVSFIEQAFMIDWDETVRVPQNRFLIS